MNRTTVIDYHKAAQSLIKWIKTKVPNCRVVSIPTDLRSGVLLCQLVNAIMPKTIESSLFMDNNDAENVVLYAIEAAREVLGIPALINAKDIADGVTDEKSLITYLALFRSADRMLVRGIRPVVPRRNDCGIGRKIYQCKRGQTGTMAYGFGIRYGEVGKPTEFIVQIDRADKSDVQISIKCTPENEDAPKVRAEPSLRCIGESVYIVSYTPVIAGYYEISVLCDLNHINNSPFKIRVKEPNIGFKCSNESVNAISVDSSKRTLPGDYLLFSDDSRCFANNAELDYISGKGSYRPESLNTVDSGIDSVLYNECSSDHVSLTDNSERGSQARTVTSSPNILSKGGSESSAFSDFDFFEATGHGLDSGEVGVMSHFEVRTPIGSNGPLSVVVTCPAVSIPTPFVSSKTDGDQLIHNVMFLPTEPGTYQIELIWGGKLITGSPYSAIVTEAIASQPMMSDNADLDTFLSEAAKNERKAVLYYSATSGDTRHARRCQYLESILHSEIEHLKLKRIAVDLEIQSDERRQLFSKVNVSQSSNSLPFVFLNEKFLGTFETLIRMHRRGDLKEYIDREFDCFRTFEESDDLVDFKTLREIKTALNALKSPLLSEN